MRRSVSAICVGCLGALSSLGMNFSGSGGVLLYGARIDVASIAVWPHESSSGTNHLEHAIHVENSRESMASISASVLPRCPASRSLNSSVGRAFIPPRAS